MFVAGALITLLVFAQRAGPRSRPADPLLDHRLPARPPRRAGDRARAVRPRLRRLLHQRPGRSLPPRCGRGSSSSTGSLLACSWRVAGIALFGVVVGRWAAEGFGELSEAQAGDRRRDADRDRRADLLHVVPALDPRPALPRRRAVAAADMSAILTTRRRAELTWQSFEGWVGSRSSASSLFLVALRSCSRCRASCYRSGPGRDMGRYVQAYLQLGYHEPVLTSRRTRAGRSPRSVSGSRSSSGVRRSRSGWPPLRSLDRRVGASCRTRRAGRAAASGAPARHPGYGILFHGLSSDCAVRCRLRRLGALLARAIERPIDQRRSSWRGSAWACSCSSGPANQVLSCWRSCLSSFVRRVAERARWGAVLRRLGRGDPGLEGAHDLRYGDATGFDRAVPSSSWRSRSSCSSSPSPWRRRVVPRLDPPARGRSDRPGRGRPGPR